MQNRSNDEQMEQEIEALVQQLTLEEKIDMVHGNGLFRSGAVERLGIPAVVSSDGPMGVRMEFQNNKWIQLNLTDDYVSYNPSNAALAATWSKELAYESGKVLGEEARGRGKDIILGPGINIKRNPICGRNFEYMSEDPCLVEELAVPFIRGVQENDIAACVKHFAVNNQEAYRLEMSVEADERTLREIYFPGFYAAVTKAGSYALMEAYNKFRGIFCSENKELLDDVLRKEWKYDGVVISDWGAVHSTVESANTSLDLEMGVEEHFDDYFYAKPLLQAVLDGKVSEETIDNKVRNLLRLMYRVKLLGKDADQRKKGAYNTVEHHEKLRKVAQESIVLLKNEADQKGGTLLPMDEKRFVLSNGRKHRIAVIGQNAIKAHAGGGGSAEIRALYEITPYLGIKMEFGGNVDVAYAPGYYVPDKVGAVTVNGNLIVEREANVNRSGELRNDELLREACELAKSADTVIFVGGLNHDYDVEGADRPNMKLPYEQDSVIEELLKIKPDTIVILIGGSPVEMPWRDRARAILWCYYAGMETGNALMDVLLGRVNPSAKLPESFPNVYEDTPCVKIGEYGGRNVEYKEGVFVGYRYYEKEGVKVAYPFGYGLSYTTFAMDNLHVVSETDEELLLSLDIKNTGSRAGAEVVQAYVQDVSCSVERPVKELRAFEKVFLAPGEVKEVTLRLPRRAFAFYSVEQKDFVVESGEFIIHVGNASDHCMLHLKVTR